MAYTLARKQNRDLKTLPNRFAFGFSAVSIQDIIEHHAETAKAVKMAVARICQHFANRQNCHKEESIIGISKTIISASAHRFSVYGLIHFFDCLERRVTPFESFDMQFGFPPAEVARAMSVYLKYSESEYRKFADEQEEKSSTAADMAGALRAAPERVLTAFKDLEQKFEDRKKAMQRPAMTYEEKIELEKYLQGLFENKDIMQRIGQENREKNIPF